MQNGRFSKLLVNLVVILTLFSQIAGPIPALAKDAGAAQAEALFNPVFFIENVGQFGRSGVSPAGQGAEGEGSAPRFQVLGAGYTSWLTADSLWMTALITDPAQSGSDDPLRTGEALLKEAVDGRRGVHLKISFVGANPSPVLEPFDRLETHISYFSGGDPQAWHADVPVWGGVRYIDLYPGIDLEVTGQNGRMVQRLRVHEGADLRLVQMRVEGAERIELAGGLLLLETAAGPLSVPLLQIDAAGLETFPQPVISDNVIAAPFTRAAPGVALTAPQAGAADLLYSTFLGGAADDSAYGIAVDSSGSAYVTGYTESADFPVTPGSFDTDYHGGDVFVAKLNSGGTALSYATFLGGLCMDSGADIAVDAGGTAFVTGSTCSALFPTTPGSFDPGYNGGMYGYDAFVTRINSNGTALLYSGFLGGAAGEEGAYGIAIDSSGAAYVTGWTSSTDFPSTDGALDRSFNGDWSDVFVTKIDPTGAAVSYATLLGGAGDEDARDIGVDSSGAAYIVGETESVDFPATSGAFDSTINGNYDVFVTKLNAGGSALAYSTFLGGSNWDEGRALAVDASGAAYVTGETASGFPITPGAFDPNCSGGDAFVTKLTPTGSKLAYSTCIGGSASEYGFGIAVDASGSAYATGWTHSFDFPTTPAAFDRTINGYEDAFVVKLNPTGSGLTYGTFLGGSNTSGADTNYGYALAVDPGGRLYIAGKTGSSDFPVTPGAYDAGINGSLDSFVAKLAAGAAPSTYSISGRVLQHGNGLYDVTISDGAGHSTTTDNGYFMLSGLAAGTYTITPSSSSGFSFLPASRTVTVPSSAANLDFTTIQPLTGKTPIIFVHGWRGFPPKVSGCTDDKYQRVTPEEAKGYFQGVGDDLRVAGGYSDGEIFYARLVSNQCYTPSLESNVPNLMEAIDLAKNTTGKPKVVLIAHSMGGLVARAYIEGQKYRGDVEALFTFGSPHLGTPPAGLALLLDMPFLDGCEKYQPAVCDFSLNGMVLFNLTHHKNKNVVYHVISGDAPFLSRSPLGMEMAALLPGPDDGIVPTDSGRAVLLGKFDRLTTDEVHGPGADGFGPNTYFVRSGGPSISYSNCIKKILVNKGINCGMVGVMTPEASDPAGALAQHTPIQQGTLLPGGSAVMDLSHEGGPSLFAVRWSDGSPSFTLDGPGGHIDPVYATNNPGVVTYVEDAHSAAYYFPDAAPGPWQMTVQAGLVPSNGTTYSTFAAFDSSISLSGSSDKQWYAPASTATLTANLEGSPLAASVTAEILRADGVLDVLTLSSIGNGQYQASYVIPDAPGYAEFRLSASGTTSGGLSFERQISQAFQISPDTFSLGHTYSESTSLFPGLSLYQDLTISMEVSSAAGGTLGISADLVDGNGNFVAHGLATQEVNAGTSTLDVRFSGADIFSSRRDGPYTLTHVLLMDQDSSALVVQEAQAVYTTAPYLSKQFVSPDTFTDVPLTHWAVSYIERLYLAGITGGCSANPMAYCPAAYVNRAQMAVFLLRGKYGSAYTPPAASGAMFSDVPANYWAAAWIENLASEGITSGCGGGKYCPENVVTRAQMAVFLLRGKHGTGYTPPAATGIFGDVPSNHWAAAWIEQLSAEGITGGCGNGNYCPESAVSRDQMAVFLVKTFNLP